MSLRRRVLLAMAIALTAIVAAGPSNAQSNYPSRPVRVIIPWGTGGNSDIMSRVLGERMSQLLGQPFIVENRPGGTGVVGASMVARAPADGHTLLVLASTMITGQALSGNREVDAPRDFEPIGLFSITPMILEVHPSVPARNVAELIAYAKANPGKLAGASGGVGATAHLLLELLKLKAGLDITHVPYQSGGQAVNDLVGGHVQMYFDVPPTAIPAARDGRVRLLAVTAPQRVSFLPDLPTFSEQGITDMDAAVWLGLMAPKGTPAQIVSRLNEVMNRALADATVIQRFQAAGSAPTPGTPEKVSSLAKTDFDKWLEVVRKANIKVN